MRQWRLLDLQAIDTRLDQLAHARTTLPVLAELAALDQTRAGVAGQLLASETALSDVQREVDKAESDVALVRDRAARDRARLDSGTGSAKDLQALTHEIESLARRQATLEDVELEVMERAEGLEREVAELRVRHDEVTALIGERTSDRDAAVADLDAEAATADAGRADVVAGVGEDLVALYERVRSKSGGIGAAALRQRRCGGCSLELTALELGRIRTAPDDEVLRCDECDRILVRTAESGL